MMFDFVGSTVLRQELERQAEVQRLERDDPDQLYRYEYWYAAGAEPTIMERLRSMIQRMRRSDVQVASPKESCPPVCEPVISS